MAKTKKQINIAQAVAGLDKDAAQLAAFDDAFAEIAAELEGTLGQLEGMEASVDADIKEIERKGQEELAEDAITSARIRDELIAEE